MTLTIITDFAAKHILLKALRFCSAEWQCLVRLQMHSRKLRSPGHFLSNAPCFALATHQALKSVAIYKRPNVWARNSAISSSSSFKTLEWRQSSLTNSPSVMIIHWMCLQRLSPCWFHLRWMALVKCRGKMLLRGPQRPINAYRGYGMTG